jgi:23S rRNA (guanine745-N1)-methyltransferase
VLPAVVELLACPYCGQPLAAAGRALACPAGHRFDLARQGYVSLLPRGVARGPTGDTAGMVAARDRFLSAGHYAPLTRALLAAAAGAGPGAVLDVGAGTGHHLAALLDAGPDRVGVALDASRYAARRAARAHPRAGAVVADAWRALPVRTGAAGLVLDVFSPRNGPETARVLAPGGTLLVVTPAADHLAELVAALGLLTVDERKDERLAGALEPHLEPVDRTEHRWPLRLPVADAVAAAAMGPSAHHLDAAELPDRAAALPDPVPATAAVELRRYRRR